LKLQPVPNRLDETILQGVSERGLSVLVNPRPGNVGTFAALGTNFGSVDRVADARGEPVPEGLAHFLEHKLFEDAQGDVSDRFSSLGASTNAMTGFCGTTYIFSATDDVKACLELLLEFVFAPYFTDELVQKEQGIIGQEIRMYDDDPDWRIFFGLLQCLFDRHPVRDNIAGSVESIADIDAKTLRRCYDLFYHPRNMCLAVSGAADVDLVREVVERDQARRPVDTLARHVRSLEDELRLPARRRFEAELPVSRPRVLLGIKETCLGGTPLEVARRQLSTRILWDGLLGRSSAAYESLYEDGLVDETFSASYSGEAGFGFSMLGGDTDRPEALEERLHDILDQARHTGLDEDVLRRTRHKLFGLLLRALDSPENAAFGMLSDHFHGVPPFSSLDLVEEISARELEQRLHEHVLDDAIATAVVRPCPS
jgi:predicted Zn-dependent peptidase